MDFQQKQRAGLVPGARRSDEAERLVSAGRVEDDDAVELKLRPQKLSEFIGQTKAKEQLAIALEAARSRGEALRAARAGQDDACDDYCQ
jgi:Holliday junction DNA helicase RuvB